MARAKRTQKIVAKSDRHGWINNETLKTRFGNFEFRNGYPVGKTAARLFENPEAQQGDRGVPDGDDAR